MRQLCCALEVSDFTGEHQASALGQFVDHPVRVEERCRDAWPSMPEGDAQPLARTLAALWLHFADLGVGDFVDERDVLAFLEVELFALATHRHAVAVCTRVVPQ